MNNTRKNNQAHFQGLTDHGKEVMSRYYENDTILMDGVFL